MQSTKSGNPFERPSDMVMEAVRVLDIAKYLAERSQLPAGDYDVVIEYKIGSGDMRISSTETWPSMAVTFDGIGLRKSTKRGPLTITIDGPSRSIKKEAKVKKTAA